MSHESHGDEGPLSIYPHTYVPVHSSSHWNEREKVSAHVSATPTLINSPSAPEE